MVKRRLRVAVLCSRRAPGLLDLLRHDPARGLAYDIAGVITSDDAFDDGRAVEALGVATRPHSIRRFCAGGGATAVRNREARAAYDAETVAQLERWAPDLVLLAGYLYLVTAPVLTRYAGRLLNLHFADLTLRRPDGRPRFPGIRAVRDAIAAGTAVTAATVHLVNAGPDEGAPLVRSWAFPVSPLVHDARGWCATEMLSAYAFAHQEWMIRAASGPLWAAALGLIASGAIDLDRYDGAGPWPATLWTLERSGRLRRSEPPREAEDRVMTAGGR